MAMKIPAASRRRKYVHLAHTTTIINKNTVFELHVSCEIERDLDQKPNLQLGVMLRSWVLRRVHTPREG